MDVNLRLKILLLVLIPLLVLTAAGTLKLFHAAENLNARRMRLHTPHGEVGALLMGPNSGGPFPAVITMHGFGGCKEQVAEAYGLAERGVVTLSIDHLDHGESGGILRWGGEYEIVREAVEFLRGLPYVDENRLCLLGVSYGGLLSLTSGITLGKNLVQAVIAVAAPTDLEHLVQVNTRLLDALRRARDTIPISEAFPFSPVNLLDNFSPASMPKFYLIHGDADEVVPVEQTLIFEDRAKRLGTRVRLTVLERVGHSLGGKYREALDNALGEAIGNTIGAAVMFERINCLRKNVTIGIGCIGILLPFLVFSPRRTSPEPKGDRLGFLTLVIFACVLVALAATFGYVYISSDLSLPEVVCLFLAVFAAAAFLLSAFLWNRFERAGLRRALVQTIKREKENLITSNILKTLAISFGLLIWHQAAMHGGASSVLTVLNGFIPGYFPALLLACAAAVLAGELVVREMFQARVRHGVIHPLIVLTIIAVIALASGALDLALSTLGWSTLLPFLLMGGSIGVYDNTKSWVNSGLYYLPALLLLLTTLMH
ncbi:MAG: prolyl oligopeptidase family serine peptidase [Candidatus Hadarchaeales archaeon]